MNNKMVLRQLSALQHLKYQQSSLYAFFAIHNRDHLQMPSPTDFFLKSYCIISPNEIWRVLLRIFISFFHEMATIFS